MIIAQISDTHVVEQGKKTCGRAPMAENLMLCVDSINNLTPTPDLVLVSGDITNDFSRDQATRAAQILGELDSPYYLVPGNHDDRDALWQVFGGSACMSRTDDGFINYVIDDFPVRVIALDTVIQGQPGGCMCKSRLTWLRDCLEHGGDRPTVIFMHHPPLKLGVQETDVDGFVGAELLGDIVAEYPNIERILCGHIHLQSHARWRGTVVTTAPSIGMQLTLDLTQMTPSKFLLSDPAYLLHLWTPDQRFVTHMIQLSELAGPFRFS